MKHIMLCSIKGTPLDVPRIAIAMHRRGFPKNPTTHENNLKIFKTIKNNKQLLENISKIIKHPNKSRTQYKNKPKH